jgi:predicted phage tail protein
MIERKLHLYGPLAERYGAVHTVFAQDLITALRIIDCNHPGFLYYVRKGRFHCANGDGRLRWKETPDTVSVTRGKSQAQEIPEHALAVPRSKGDWHLVPVLEGAKGGTFKTIFSIIVGGALLFTGIGGAVAGAVGLSTSTITTMGMGLLLGGISQLLAPTPKTDTSEKKPTSFSFDGPSEVGDEGGPIPLLFGELVIGSFPIASSVESTGTGGGSLTAGVPGFAKGGSGYSHSSAALS